MPTRTKQTSVALNSDIGEGFGNWTVDDEAILSTVSDANIACGFHAGDPDTIARTCQLSAQYGLGIGAHVGYHDLRGFGRRYIAVPQETLTNDILYQIGALDAFVTASGAGTTSYVKPHGALYHSANKHDDHAQAVVNATLAFDRGLSLLCQAGSLLAKKAESAGIEVVAEGFMDRTYNPDGTLVPRGEPGAVISDPSLAAEQAVQMVTEQTVTAVDGTVVSMPIQSLCVHSDSPGAIELARAVRSALENSGVAIVSATATVRQ
ncbi:MAG: LamB/YcsF family protein [Comamonadaceae bacterium]|nr:MAG: LamB/YcsF family protein [Comamonadaceae bacterium]